MEEFKKWVLEHADFLTHELRKPEFHIPGKDYPERLQSCIQQWLIQLPKVEDVVIGTGGDFYGTTRNVVL